MRKKATAIDKIRDSRKIAGYKCFFFGPIWKVTELENLRGEKGREKRIWERK